MKDTFSWEDSYLGNSSLPVFLIYSSLLPLSPYGKINPCSFQLFILGDLATCTLAYLSDPSGFAGVEGGDLSLGIVSSSPSPPSLPRPASSVRWASELVQALPQGLLCALEY